jgi:hypothetical protein
MNFERSSNFIYFIILLNFLEQCKLAIRETVFPFSEHNFDPFRHIFFVIVMFESASKTLFTECFLRTFSECKAIAQSVVNVRRMRLLAIWDEVSELFTITSFLAQTKHSHSFRGYPTSYIDTHPVIGWIPSKVSKYLVKLLLLVTFEPWTVSKHRRRL